MDPMKKEKKETAFYNKYIGCLEEIEDCQFADESIRGEMRRRYTSPRICGISTQRTHANHGRIGSSGKNNGVILDLMVILTINPAF